MRDRNAVANLVLAMAPEMEELKMLREEVVRLRSERMTHLSGHPPELALAQIINGEDGPVRITVNESGRWDFSLRLSDKMRTGGSGYETDVKCLQAAVSHAASCYEKLESENEDDET